MRLQMALLAVDGNKESGLEQSVDDLQFLLAGVAGDVQALKLVIDDLCTLAVELVDDLADGFFVSGDGGRGDNYTVRLRSQRLTV